MPDAEGLRREIEHVIEPDRAATDASLRGERKQADAAIEQHTDDKLEHTRAIADESIEANLGIVAASLAEERQEVDAAVREERARVSERLRAEREFVNEALQEEREAKRTLLEAERIMTDRDLAREREDTDRAVGYSVSLLQNEQNGHRRALDVIIARDEYLSIVSHDLRTPLNVISVSANLLADHAEDETRVKECTHSISRAAALMERMLSDLLDATRFEEGRFRLSPRHQDTVEVVKEGATTFAPLAQAGGVTLRVDTPASAVYARFDYDRIIQVLSNLLRNALQFTPRGGMITVSVAEDHGGARISVSDTGKGIPAADLERIFDRFHQAGDADRRGLGLGLYISKAIVDAHAGRIWAASEPGHGSTFFFTLPA